MKPELLLPAGSVEKLEYAIEYGADAVYLGVVDYSLRAMRKGEIINIENLKSTIELAHKKNKKAYLTLNIFAFDKDIKQLENDIEKISEANADALIISDFGILNVVKKYCPTVQIHVSTQTNTLNSEAVKFWKDLGASRIILARELSLDQMKAIREENPNIELEVFVHGAQCMSFSGRCLLSDYLTEGNRKANQGNCSQPCRWSYKLLEETRPNEYFEIEQNQRGTHILSTKDLALIKYIPKLIEAGIDSFKIEGRTKSLYYVSAVARTYRKAIDNYFNNIEEDLTQELLKIGNRGYTTGFFIDPNHPQGYSYNISKGLAGADFLCVFEQQHPSLDNVYKVKIKNKINLNDKIEVIEPKNSYIVKVVEIFDETLNENKQLGNTNDCVWIRLDKKISNPKYALSRTIGIKDYF